MLASKPFSSNFDPLACISCLLNSFSTNSRLLTFKAKYVFLSEGCVHLSTLLHWIETFFPWRKLYEDVGCFECKHCIEGLHLGQWMIMIIAIVRRKVWRTKRKEKRREGNLKLLRLLESIQHWIKNTSPPAEQGHDSTVHDSLKPVQIKFAQADRALQRLVKADFPSRSICGSQQSLNHLEVCCTRWRLRTPDSSVALLLSTNIQPKLMLIISQRFWIVFTEKSENMICFAFPAMTSWGRTRLRHLTPTMMVWSPGRMGIWQNDWFGCKSVSIPGMSLSLWLAAESAYAIYHV